VIYWGRGISKHARLELETIIARLRLEWMAPFHVDARPRLSSYRGKIESATGRGFEIHAASDMRRRRMLLDSDLIGHPAELRRIFTHELFHFIWIRMGNSTRRRYEEMLSAEIRKGARGELGWSAEWRKEALAAADLRRRTRRWREYACESFCDTGAWLNSRSGRHGEFTLAKRWRARRWAWFQEAIDGSPQPV